MGRLDLLGLLAPKHRCPAAFALDVAPQAPATPGTLPQALEKKMETGMDMERAAEAEELELHEDQPAHQHEFVVPKVPKTPQTGVGLKDAPIQKAEDEIVPEDEGYDDDYVDTGRVFLLEV